MSCGPACAIVIAQLEAERDAERARADKLQAQVADYENRITWNTTCAQCAAHLDAAIRDHERAEKAEAELAESDHVLQATGRKLELVREQRDAALAALKRVRALCEQRPTRVVVWGDAIPAMVPVREVMTAAALPEPTEPCPECNGTGLVWSIKQTSEYSSSLSRPCSRGCNPLILRNTAEPTEDTLR